MAGYARYTALIDACVWHSVAVSDSILSVYTAGQFAPKWTAKIDDEWTTSLGRERGLAPTVFHGRRDKMREAVPDWEVVEEAWQAVSEGLQLPDADDVHVLAAAISGPADCIVTFNTADFPASVAARFNIEVIHPDDFLINQFDLDPFSVAQAFREQRARLKNPALTAEAFANALERNGLVRTAQRLRDIQDLI